MTQQKNWLESFNPTLIPQTSIDHVRSWLAHQYIELELVRNIEPGYLIVVPIGLGRGVKNIDAYEDLRTQAIQAQIDAVVPPLPPWRHMNMLQYAPARSAFAACNFRLYLNFFGESLTPQLAITVPVAQKLELFRKEWVRDTYEIDGDYENGGDGPFLAAPAYSNFFEPTDPLDRTQLLERGIETIDQYEYMNTPAKKLLDHQNKYLEERMKRVIDGKPADVVDELVNIKNPTLAEQGRGELPPSRAAGNPDDSGEPLELREDGLAPTSQDNVRNATQVLGNVVRYSAVAPRPDPREFHTLFAHTKPLVETVRTYLVERNLYDTLNESYVNEEPLNLPIEDKRAIARMLVPKTPYTKMHSFIIRTETFTIDMIQTSASVLPIRDMAAMVLREVYESEEPLLPIDEDDEQEQTYASPNTVFVLASPEGAKTKTNKDPWYCQYGVAADNAEFGLFASKREQFLYTHLIKKGGVAFAVEQQDLRADAVRFFPEKYACGYAWWWMSKVDRLPLSMRWNTLASGSHTVLRRLEPTTNTERKEDRFVDAFAFLPPMRTCYNQSLKSANVSTLFAACKQNGLLRRDVYFDDDATVKTLRRPMRELVLSTLAASSGFGPRVFAAWIVPAGVQPVLLSMNAGDKNAAFADPMYNAFEASSLESYKTYQKPAEPWLAQQEENNTNDGVRWDGKSGTASYANLPEELSDYELQHENRGWQQMTMLIESFEGVLKYMIIENEQQAQEVATQILSCMDLMSSAGIMHCALEDSRIVYRTWRSDNQNVTTTTPWDTAEVRVVDFDPVSVKLVPWLNSDALFVVNLAMLLAQSILSANDSVLKNKAVSDRIVPELKRRVELVKQQFPNDTGFVSIFQSLKPARKGREETGPTQLSYGNGIGVIQNPRVTDDADTFHVLNDPFEASRAFQTWVEEYIELHSEGASTDSAPILSRLLSIVHATGFQNASNIDASLTFSSHRAIADQQPEWAGLTSARHERVAQIDAAAELPVQSDGPSSIDGTCNEAGCDS
jgi:hypothetical protein